MAIPPLRIWVWVWQFVVQYPITSCTLPQLTHSSIRAQPRASFVNKTPITERPDVYLACFNGIPIVPIWILCILSTTTTIHCKYLATGLSWNGLEQEPDYSKNGLEQCSTNGLDCQIMLFGREIVDRVFYTHTGAISRSHQNEHV